VIGVVRLTHQNCVMLFLSLGYSVSPTVLDLLVSKFDKTRGKSRAIEYDNFIERCLTVKFKVDILESINLCGTFSTEFAMNCWMFGQAEGNVRMTVIHLMSP